MSLTAAVAGDVDNYYLTGIYEGTRMVGGLMKAPGRLLLLRGTGHSIHIERPQYFAAEIAKFLADGRDVNRSWPSLGGVLTSEPAAALNPAGGFVVFARGTDNALWHTAQTAAGGAWQPWASLGGLLTSGPAAATYRDGRLNVFVRSMDNAIWTRWQTAPNGAWSEWASLGGVLTSNPAAALNAPGGVVVFARGTDDAIRHTWQDYADGDWSAWTSLGGVLTSHPAAALYRDGRLNVFARGTDNAIWTGGRLHRMAIGPTGGRSAAR